MKNADINAMLAVARDILRPGSILAPSTTSWAQAMVSAYPTDKQPRARPLIDAILGLFELADIRAGGVTGLRAAGITGLPPQPVHQMLYRLRRDGHLHHFRPPGAHAGRYFLTAADLEAAQTASQTAANTAPAAANRVAAGVVANPEKTSPKPVKPAKPPKEPKVTTPRKPKPGAVDANAKMLRRNSTNFNPDLGRPGQRTAKEKWADAEAIRPPGLVVQIGPGLGHDPRYQCAKDARPEGAGLMADWVRRRWTAEASQ